MSFLYDIQAMARDYLQTDEYFRDIEILTEDSLDIGNTIELALAENQPGKLKGIVIEIQMLTGSVPSPDVPSVHFMPAQAQFDVFENITVNRGEGGNGKKGLVVAENLLAVMSRFNSSETTAKFWHALDAIERIDKPQWGVVVHRCRMNCHGGSNDTTEVVEQPAISSLTLTVTLSCPTAGASIYYTVDGSRPQFFGAGNAANVGTLYTGPFAVASGTVVTARGVKTGLRSSILQIATIT